MKSIKDKIRQHLAKVTEATAKKIGVAIGMKDYPSDVVKALSEMRTDAEVECEKRKGSGNEYWYWLTNVTADVALASEGDMPADKECCNAAKVVATTAGREVEFMRQEIKNLQHANTSLAVESDNRKKRIASMQEELDDRKEVIDSLNDDIRRQSQRAAAAEQNRDDLQKRIEKLEADQSYREGVIQDLNAQLGHARIQIDALNEQLMNGEEAVDVKDAARGYLVCAPKRKPAKLMKAESAVARAKSAAKATGRGEVFALVPVGVATRKQIQAIEFKERAA